MADPDPSAGNGETSTTRYVLDKSAGVVYSERVTLGPPRPIAAFLDRVSEEHRRTMSEDERKSTGFLPLGCRGIVDRRNMVTIFLSTPGGRHAVPYHIKGYPDPLRAGTHEFVLDFPPTFIMFAFERGTDDRLVLSKGMEWAIKEEGTLSTRTRLYRAWFPNSYSDGGLCLDQTLTSRWESRGGALHAIEKYSQDYYRNTWNDDLSYGVEALPAGIAELMSSIPAPNNPCLRSVLAWNSWTVQNPNADVRSLDWQPIRGNPTVGSVMDGA